MSQENTVSNNTSKEKNSRKLNKPYKPVILVTGGNSGIGLAIAKKLREYPQYRVVVTARDSSIKELEKKLPQNDNFWIHHLDVTLQAERKELIRNIEKRWGGVDILINNAGISYRSVVEHMTEQDELKQLKTNYLGPMALIRKVLPHMREQGRGKIINISSVSGMLAMPTMSSYSASKHALEGASEALWYEMRALGVNVSLVQLGFIRSNSFTHVYYSEAAKEAETTNAPYSDFYKAMAPFVAKMMKNSLTTPEAVAKKVIWTIRKQNPPLRVPATLDAIVFYYLRRLIPRRLFHPFLYRCLPGANKWGEGYTNARPPKKWFL